MSCFSLGAGVYFLRTLHTLQCYSFEAWPAAAKKSAEFGDGAA